MQKVWLHPAFVWDCEECGRENFCRAVRADCDEETLAFAKERIGVAPDEEGEFLQAPTHVTCAHCGITFDAADDLDPDDGEDNDVLHWDEQP